MKRNKILLKEARKEVDVLIGQENQFWGNRNRKLLIKKVHNLLNRIKGDRL